MLAERLKGDGQPIFTTRPRKAPDLDLSCQRKRMAELFTAIRPHILPDIESIKLRH